MVSDLKEVPEYLVRQRSSLRKFLADYLNHRSEKLLIGEFLDDAGCRSDQFGLAGTAFMLFVSRRHGIDAEVLRFADDLLKNIDHAETSEKQRLLKDIPRVAAKTALLTMLLPKKEADPLVEKLFKDFLSGNNLLKPVADATNKSGDIVNTCYVLQLLYIGRVSTYKQRSKISATIQQLSNSLHSQDIDILTRLYVSSTICLFDFDQGIKKHRAILKDLYRSDMDWAKTLPHHASYIDVFFSDSSGSSTRNRYVRIPAGFVILLAIFINVGSDANFYKLAYVKDTIMSIGAPYTSDEGLDRARATSYYIFFQFIILHFSEYISVPKAGYFRRKASSITYATENLTWKGVVEVALSFLGLGAAIFYLLTPEKDGNLQKLVNVCASLAITLTGLLGLSRTKKR
ncbi:hypothetical protein LB565_20070 [Mesorhizobium sp. CA14]|uniref:hypothetical protein n=1 Tax=Mesorhizobium sp. CA14 TaxID=2876642 RepID=UPI001CCD2AF9|nr:hypothetical protein [Mesorhizobium sp. CA14]MBZ9850284.1 hypothetical protein [Mesorhizobium sp. CA14]